MKLSKLAKRVVSIIKRAEKAGLHIDDGNVVDLIADNANATLIEIRDALVETGMSNRFPNATGPRYRNPAPRRGVRIVHNRLLGGWYVVRGPHQTPLNGRFNSKEEAQAWLRQGNPAPRRGTRNAGRRSQISGRAPSGRLVKRRRRNVRKGFFPNPAQVRAAQRKHYQTPRGKNLQRLTTRGGFRYVLMKETKPEKWESFASFGEKRDAIHEARQYAMANRCRVKIMDSH